MAGTWILVSDRLLVLWLGAARAQSLQTLKGWFFVGVTTVLLWIVLRGYWKVGQRAQEELLEAERKLAHSRRLEALGKLAASVAHDFNQVLTAVIGYQELASGRLAEGELDPALLGSDLREIRRAADRGASLASQLLALGRKPPSRLLDLPLETFIERAPDLLRPFLGAKIGLRVAAPREPMLIRADVRQLEQVLVNLVVNARDAMPDGGEITLRASPVTLDNPADELPELSPGHYARLEVTDTGMGLDADTRDHIFEPFFTTKGEGGGTGLGLSVVRRIVAHHGGAVAVTSAPGAGTTFRIYLPLAGRASGARSGSEARRAPGPGVTPLAHRLEDKRSERPEQPSPSPRR